MRPRNCASGKLVDDEFALVGLSVNVVVPEGTEANAKLPVVVVSTRDDWPYLRDHAMLILGLVLVLGSGYTEVRALKIYEVSLPNSLPRRIRSWWHRNVSEKTCVELVTN